MDLLVQLNSEVDRQFDIVSANTGLGADQIKFLTCAFASYPLGIILSFLPNGNAKHIFSLICGLVSGWISMGPQLIHMFLSSTITYLIILLLPPKRSAQLVYIFLVAYLSGSHIYRMITDYMGYTLDFTGPQMVLTLKLTMLAIDLYDGTKKPEELTSHGKIMHLKTTPNPLQYYAYVFFFLGISTGPAFNFREYLEYSNGSLFRDAPGGRMPSPFLAFAKNTVIVALLAVGVIINMEYSLYYCRTNEFYTQSLFYRLFYVWIAGVFSRFPYYFAWKLSEGSCILAGIGYTKMEDGVAKWDRATNCDITTVELAQNFREVTVGWNLRTDRWLKHYIYERVSVMPLALTFLNSALWHGFYPGYYFSFFTASVIVQVARGIRRSFRPWFLEADGQTPKSTKFIYDIVCTVITGYALNYTMAPFVVLGFEYSIRLWSSLYFVVHIGVFVTWLLATFVIRPPKHQKKST